MEEDFSSFIVFGRASKIPPISESLITSNISFEERGVNNVSKPCSRLQQPLSVSRGVRSRPPEEEVASHVKVETTPLLSPTMELNLLKEPWVFPQTKLIPPMEDDSSATTFQGWEENFQDLSGWCMDPFQGQCDFPIGELVSFKLSGTKYEGKDVSNLDEGVSEGASRGVNEKKWSSKINSLEDMELLDSQSQPLLHQTNSTLNCKKEIDEMEYNESNTWLRLSRGNSSVTNSKMNTSNVNIPFNSEHRISNLDLDNTCQNTFESTDSNNQPVTWDMLNTVQTNGSDTFDLLSYLCEDEMNSSAGSISTDASTIFNSRSPIEELPTVIEDPEEDPEEAIKMEVEVDKVRRPVQTRSTSTITSSSSETFPVSLRKSERTRTSNRVEKKYSTGRRESKKRPVEDTASVRVSSFNYRESREKNNEASRKSRMNKKAKESEMVLRAIELEKDNRVLKMKVEELEKLVTSMRTALLRSALKKEN